MDGHVRKLDRAGIERIELMEVCPVCGEQRRNSARFCTTCGHRFATDEIANALVPPAPIDVNPLPGDEAEPVISGWPAATSHETASAWAPPADDRGGWPAPPVEPGESQMNSAASEVTWAEVAATAFSVQDHAQPVAGFATDIATIVEFDTVEDGDLEADQPEGGHHLLRERARALMSELQEVVDGLSGGASGANNELASELEISLTRPAALEGEALADLRAAAEAAQERPRDLDTLTALTAQADTILALIVGYERATAGIERAMETLRNRPATAAG